MKPRYSFLMALLIIMGFTNPAFPIEEATHGKAIQADQYLRTVQELIERLDPRSQPNTLRNTVDILKAANTGLNETVLPLLEAKAEPPTGELTHAKELGFNTGLKGATVRETPFPILEVELNDLRDFAPSKESTIPLVFTNQLLFPVEVNNQVKSSITLRYTPNIPGKTEQKENKVGWQLARWGQRNLIQLLTKEEARLVSQKPTAQSRFLLKIPALNRVFLGYDDKGVIRLIPLVNDHIFTIGESYSAHDVFKWLSAEAKNMDDSPR
nr:hypothetical protein [Nitrosomonas nitrosa]